MEKSTNKRMYLDYNATSPLANSVVELMVKGDFPFGNPSSLHSSGKLAYSYLRKAEQGILKLFSLSDEHAVLFHSGATEGINTFIKGCADTIEQGNNHLHFIAAATDHPAVYSMRDVLRDSGHHVHTISINQLGHFNFAELTSLLKAVAPAPVLLNYTWVNNETGVVNHLVNLDTLKERFPNLVIHVDGVQAPGKIRDWDRFPLSVDVFTFSGHKFGALKGTGFSIYKKSLRFSPLLHGGGQQLGMRSGTINVLGAYAQYLALEELKIRFNSDKAEEAILALRLGIKKFLGNRGHLIADGGDLALNILSFIVYGKRSDILLAACDMAGLEVSAGSACSAGAILPNRVLMAHGISADDSQSYLRLSFAPDLDIHYALEVKARLEKVLSRFL